MSICLFRAVLERTAHEWFTTTSANVYHVTARARAVPAASATVETRSAEETRDFAARLAAVARPGDRLALLGPLGAGKTQFAKGFAAGLGVSDIVNSPSFTLMAEYAGRLPLFHQDLYRLSGAEEVLGGGLVDERQEDGVTLVEWGDRLPRALDPRRVIVRFAVGEGDQRLVAVETSGSEGARYVSAARTWSST
jgi:tRNA threonylcarbamoyladenosine biosynthesis protein TsaE